MAHESCIYTTQRKDKKLLPYKVSSKEHEKLLAAVTHTTGPFPTKKVTYIDFSITVTWERNGHFYAAS